MLRSGKKIRVNIMTLLHIEKNKGIAIVSLNRPEKRNAMSFDLLKALVQTAKQLKKDRSIRTCCYLNIRIFMACYWNRNKF